MNPHRSSDSPTPFVAWVVNTVLVLVTLAIIGVLGFAFLTLFQARSVGYGAPSTSVTSSSMTPNSSGTNPLPPGEERLMEDSLSELGSQFSKN